MPTKKFILIAAFPPVINDKLVEGDIDSGVGGVKLIYQQNGTKINLGPDKETQRIFLKPLKKRIADDKKECEASYGKGSWGNTISNLSNTWLEITSGDYDDIRKSYKFIRHEQVADQDLIKNLNRQLKEFVLGTDEPITKLPFSERARLFWDKVRNR